MKRKLVCGSLILILIGIMSCKRTESGSEGSLAASLATSVAEVVGNQVSITTGTTDQAVAMEPFNGFTSAALISGDSVGHFSGDSLGSHPGHGHHGWIFSSADHFLFGVPHIDSCVTVYVSSSSYPRQIIITYIKDCSTHHHDKSGKVIINLSDTITNAGAVQTVEYQDFYIDSIKVDLNATLKNMGKNSNGNWVIEKTYEQTITKGDEVAVRKNTETQEWLSGFGTTDKSDDSYYLSGSGSIVVNDTAKFSKVITTPLLFEASCDYIMSGVVELTRNSVTSTIDYGDGTCDDVATVTTNGTTEEINLHSARFRTGSHFDTNCPGFGRKHGWMH
jgi:hypothetical protein